MPNMDQTGLINKVIAGAANIDRGRKGFATDGEEHQGRLNYEDGIATASAAFMEAQASADPKTMMLAEEAFIEQELQFCSEQDTHTRSSLEAALQSFEDAFLALEAVEGSGYREADKTWPHNHKNRIQGFPKDAFHQACIAHRTRLNNVLRAPGINMIEKAVLEQRTANMTAAEDGYIEKQKKALL
jgi:hypothetical protein